MTNLTPDEQRARIEDAKTHFRESVAHIDDASIAEAAATGDAKLRKLQDAIPDALEAIWSDLTTLVALVKDYAAGTYREIPFGSIAAIACAVLYFVSPLDVIPDFIPVVGYLDDAAVLKLCLGMVRKDLDKYRQWKDAPLD